MRLSSNYRKMMIYNSTGTAFYFVVVVCPCIMWLAFVRLIFDTKDGILQFIIMLLFKCWSLCVTIIGTQKIRKELGTNDHY